jgi:large subunit ribosomal protein L25
MELGSAIRVRDIDPVEGIEIMSSPSIPVATVEVPRALRSAATAAAKEGEEEAVAE